MDDVVKTDGVLDLRPARGSLVYQLLRLGLSFDHKDASGETWTCLLYTSPSPRDFL